jgi:hypothetical protein
MSEFLLLTENHDPSKNVVKAICSSEEKRKHLLEHDAMLKVLNPTNSTSEDLIINCEPSIRPIAQCITCKKLGHRSENCTTKIINCAKCGEPGHEENEFKCKSNRECCVNCFGNHNAFNRKCPDYRLKKDESINDELLRLGIKFKRGRTIGNKHNNYGNNRPNTAFNEVCSYANDLNNLSKRMEIVDKKCEQLSSEKLLSDVKQTMATAKESSDNVNNKLDNIIASIKTDFANHSQKLFDQFSTELTNHKNENNKRCHSIEQEIINIKNFIKFPNEMHVCSEVLPSSNLNQPNYYQTQSQNNPYMHQSQSAYNNATTVTTNSHPRSYN